MSNIAIQAKGLSKEYHIGGPQKNFDRIGDQIVDLAIAPVRRAARILRGEASGAAELNKQFWALKDVSFEINHGDVIGVLGHNGAGKSTLLKILSRITEPTSGYADVYGRISSLLEVGTGFHPELTGRENIFLNGAILGMHRAEIKRKFDDIVEFAEIDKFLDTPVKHYSSGMYVRLAFSVAAHLEPEILLVDEVLAVGDMAFQKKCLGKMDSVSKQGRTVIFVSHNMNALQRLCSKSMLLNRGELVNQGKTAEMVELYLSSTSSGATAPGEAIDVSKVNRDGSGRVRFAHVSYTSMNPATGYQPFSHGPLEFSLGIESDQARSVNSLAVILFDRYGTKLINADTMALGEPISFRKGHTTIKLRIDDISLNPGIYTIGLWVADPPSEVYDYIASAFLLEVVELEAEKRRVQSDGLVPCNFELLEVA